MGNWVGGVVLGIQLEGGPKGEMKSVPRDGNCAGKRADHFLFLNPVFVGQRNLPEFSDVRGSSGWRCGMGGVQKVLAFFRGQHVRPLHNREIAVRHIAKPGNG